MSEEKPSSSMMAETKTSQLSRNDDKAEAKDRLSGEGKAADAKAANEKGTEGFSLAVKFTSPTPATTDHVVLKFTTLSDGNEKASFVVGRKGTPIGRGKENPVSVPSDATLAKSEHARIEFRDGMFQLMDSSKEYHAAVRVGVGHAADRWPLMIDATFSAGNSIFHVASLKEGSSVVLHVLTGPLKGTSLTVTQEGATFGRANDNTVSIADRELSRKHSRVVFDAPSSKFFITDLGSTNGTYVQLVGPYAGRYPIYLNDHILVGRTGFSINRFDYGISEETGFRRTMEDKSIIVQDLLVKGLSETGRASPQTWMGVYDGHGGHEASLFLYQRLHHRVSEELALNAQAIQQTQFEPQQLDPIIKKALTTAFLDADKEFISSSGSGQAGSTATTTLLLGNRGYCANVGDSRSVLCRNGTAIALSTDHKPSREDESTRIKAAGGFIINKRVMGELAVSRAFGDCEFKKGINEILGEDAAAGMRDDSIDQDLSKPLVVAEPEFETFDITPEDDFLLLACDGLFDVLSNQEACNLILTELRAHGDPGRTAEAITKAAIDHYGSRDNVTVIDRASSAVSIAT